MKKLLIFLFVLSISLVSHAEAKPFIVGMELEYPPFETIDENGNPTGASVAIAEALGKKLGREVLIENTSYPGLIPALYSGKIDAIISSMTINEERAKRVDFSDPYTTAQLVMLAHKDSEVMSPADLNNPKVVIANKTGTIGALWARTYAPKARVRNFDKESQGVLDVAQGKSDVIIYDPLAVARYHAKYPDTTRTIMEPLPNVNGWGIAIRKGQPELLEQINQFIAESKVDGTFDRIRDTYLKEKAEEFERETGLKFFF